MVKRFECMKSFLRATGGNVAITFAIASVLVLGAAGGAVDYSRFVAARTNLYAAMDAAVLAGTKVYWDKGKAGGPALAVAQDYFNKSLSSGHNFTTLDIKFKLNSSGDGIAAFGDAAISSPLLSILGITELPVLSKTIAEADVAVGSPPGGAENVEISMMLDVTGSMCDDGNGPCSTGTKISALKTAASNLVDKVLAAGSSNKSTRVAVVPFSTRVRLDKDGQGSAIMKSVTNLQPTWAGWYNMCTAGSGSGGSETNGTWTCQTSTTMQVSNWKVMPCVTDRYYNSTGSADVTDASPGPDHWLNAHGGDRMPNWTDSNDISPTSYTGLTAGDPAYHWNYNDGGTCADIDNADAVVPLSSNASQVKSSISGLTAYGSTSGALGTAMAWYVISPNWSSVWPASSSPGAYADLTTTGSSGAPKLRKVAVLMTDGGYNTLRSWKGSDIATVSGYAKDICTNMQKSGIEVYTVGFNLDGLSASEAAYAKSTLSSCASDASHYLSADSPAELIAAFDSIGAQLTEANIRLTK